jgi:hypothetical protein
MSVCRETETNGEKPGRELAAMRREPVPVESNPPFRAKVAPFWRIPPKNPGFNHKPRVNQPSPVSIMPHFGFHYIRAYSVNPLGNQK